MGFARDTCHLAPQSHSSQKANKVGQCQAVAQRLRPMTKSRYEAGAASVALVSRPAPASWHKVCSCLAMQGAGVASHTASPTAPRIRLGPRDGCRPTLHRWPFRGCPPSCPCPGCSGRAVCTCSSRMRALPLTMRDVTPVEHASRAAPAAAPCAFSSPGGVGITFAWAEGREPTDTPRRPYRGGRRPRAQPHGRRGEPSCPCVRLCRTLPGRVWLARTARTEEGRVWMLRHHC